MKLTVAQQEQYWRHRRGQVPAVLAYYQAARTLPGGYEFDSSYVYDDRSATTTMHLPPFTIRLNLLPEPEKPTQDEREMFGTLVSANDPDAALVHFKAPEYLPTTEVGVWFKPLVGYWWHRMALSKMGMSKGVAAEQATLWGWEDRAGYLENSHYILAVDVTAGDVQLGESINGDVRVRAGRMLPDMIEWAIDSGVIIDALATARANMARLLKLVADFPSSEGQTLTGEGNG